MKYLIYKTETWLRQFSYNQIFSVVAFIIILLLILGSIFLW